MRLRIIWGCAQSAVQKLDCEFPTRLAQSEHAEVVPRAFVFWIEPQCRGVIRLRASRVTLLKLDIAECKVDLCVPGDVRVSGLELFFREREVAGFERLPTGVIVI